VPPGSFTGTLARRTSCWAGQRAGWSPSTPGDYTSDAIDWALGRSTTAGELHDRIERLCALLPGLDGDRLLEWCKATAVIIAVQYLYRRPPDQTTTLILELAASA
jgi:streptomycin 6-kinase